MFHVKHLCVLFAVKPFAIISPWLPTDRQRTLFEAVFPCAQLWLTALFSGPPDHILRVNAL